MLLSFSLTEVRRSWQSIVVERPSSQLWLFDFLDEAASPLLSVIVLKESLGLFFIEKL